MQKLFNDPKSVVDESVSGFVMCYKDYVAHTSCSRTLKWLPAPISGKVGVVSGGGSGHDPAFMGYLGKNMLDAVAIGDIFIPPSAESFYTAFKEADSGNGVVCIYGNYPPDTENVEAAIKLAKKDGIIVEQIVVNEDIANDDPEVRRGMTGEVLLWKISGAAAAQGYDLADVLRVTEKALSRMRSIGIGIASCIIPEVGRPNYVIEPGTMEIGVGHHGISSKDTCKLKTANDSADIMLDEIFRDMPLESGSKVAIMVSGLGNTTLSELTILYKRVHEMVTARSIDIHRSYIGNYFTSLDMMGATLTILNLDDELIELLDLPAFPAAFSDFSFS